MKRYSTLILRLAIFIAGAIVLAICSGALWTVIKMDSSSEYYVLSYVLLIGTCSAAAPFFIALYQSFKLLRLIDTHRAFTELSAKALKVITRTAFIEFLMCTIVGLPFLYIVAEKDDAPGLIILGMVISGAAFTLYMLASVLHRLLLDAVHLKSENDLIRGD